MWTQGRIVLLVGWGVVQASRDPGLHGGGKWEDQHLVRMKGSCNSPV